jgi:hypothetical protein
MMKWSCVIAAAVPLALSAIAASAQQSAPLPDVQVIAPAVPQQVNPFQPYSSNTRVEEAKWPEVPCNLSRIALGPGSKCQTGTPVETFLTGAGAPHSGMSRCDIAHQLVTLGNGRYMVEADTLIFDPYKVTAYGHQDKNCFVWSGYTNLPDDFRDMNQVTRRGTGWRNFVKGAPQSTMEFSDGGHNCVAVERLGPSWHGGYVWVVHAAICSATQAPLQSADIDAVFSMVELRQYDSAGNLRAQ